MSTYFEKSRHPDRKGGGVNPYGQPDRKKTGFFLTTALSIVRLKIQSKQITLKSL